MTFLRTFGLSKFPKWFQVHSSWVTAIRGFLTLQKMRCFAYGESSDELFKGFFFFNYRQTVMGSCRQTNAVSVKPRCE